MKIKVTKALCKDFCQHVTNIYGVTNSDKLRDNIIAVRSLAIDYALDYVDGQIDKYLVDDNTVNYIADKIAMVLILTIKHKIKDSERRNGICLF